METLGHGRWTYAELRGHLLPLEPFYEEHLENDGRTTVACEILAAYFLDGGAEIGREIIVG